MNRRRSSSCTTRGHPVGTSNSTMSSSEIPRGTSTAPGCCCRARRPTASGRPAARARARPPSTAPPARPRPPGTRRREERWGDVRDSAVVHRVPRVVELRPKGAESRSPRRHSFTCARPYFVGRLLLVQSLQRPVMAFVQAPAPAHRQEGTLQLVEGEVRRPHRSRQHRGVDRVELEAGFRGEEPAGQPCLVLAGGAQVHVRPAREPVLGVPGTLAMAQDDERRHRTRGYLPPSDPETKPPAPAPPPPPPAARTPSSLFRSLVNQT